jgi:hypothetical protein
MTKKDCKTMTIVMFKVQTALSIDICTTRNRSKTQVHNLKQNPTTGARASKIEQPKDSHNASPKLKVETIVKRATLLFELLIQNH